MNSLPIALLRCLLVMATCLLLSSCQHNDPLPQPTQTGSNTFGCLINGKSYVPDGGNGFMPSKPVNGGFFIIRSYSADGAGIYVRTYAKDRQRIELYLNNYALGRHLLNVDTGIKPAIIYPKDYGLYESNGESYVTSAKYTGWVNVTKADTTTGVVSGSFEFEAATQDGRTVSVTNGRFDVNHRTQ